MRMRPYLVFDASAGTTFNIGSISASYPNTLYLRNNAGQPVNVIIQRRLQGRRRLRQR